MIQENRPALSVQPWGVVLPAHRHRPADDRHRPDRRRARPRRRRHRPRAGGLMPTLRRRRPAGRRRRRRPRHRRRRRSSKSRPGRCSASSASPVPARPPSAWPCSAIARQGVTIASGSIAINGRDDARPRRCPAPPGARRTSSATSRRTRARRSTRRCASARSSSRSSNTTTSAAPTTPGANASARCMREVLLPGDAAVPAPLPAPALRRPAAASRIGDGLRLPAGGDRARRADDRPRRDHAGPRAGHGARPVPPARRGRPVRHPRPRGRRQPRRPRRRDVRRADRRGGPDRCESSPDPPIPYTRHLIAAAPDITGDQAIVGLGGRAPSPGQRPARLLLRAALRARHRRVHRRPSRPMSEVAPGHTVRCVRPCSEPVVSGRSRRRRRCSRALAPSTPRLIVDDVSASYGGIEVVHGINLHVERGECLALVGESGSGKTTLSQVDRRAAPRVDRRHPPRRHAPSAASPGHRSIEQRMRIQYVFQNPYPSLNPRRTHRRLGGPAAARSPVSSRAEASTAASARCSNAVSLTAGLRRPLPRPALRRRAPARRDRPGAGRQPRPARLRRGDVGARRPRPSGDRRAARRPATRPRPGHAVRHPQPAARAFDRRRGSR